MGDLGIAPPQLSSAPTDINLGFPVSGTAIPQPIDIASILDQLGLAPQPIDLGIPPPTPIDIPTLPPVDTLPPPPIIDIFPPPIDIGLPQPQPLPPPPGTITIFPGGQVPIGFDSSGNPIYTSTVGLPPLPPGPSTPPPAAPPTTYAPPPVTVTTTQTSGGGSAYAQAIATASINQSIQVMNQDVQPLADAVQQGIKDAAQRSADIAQQTTQAITQSLDTFSNGLFGWVKSIGEWIKNNIGPLLSSIANTIKNSLETIARTIGDAVAKAATAVYNTLEPLITGLAKEIQKIDQFYVQHIEPILRTIADIQRAVSVAIVSIERDIQTGLSGILKLPGDLVAAFSSIDQALIRAGKALKVERKQDANVYFYGDEKGSFADHIRLLHETLSSTPSQKSFTTFNPGLEKLDEPTIAQELPNVLGVMNTIIGDLAKGVRAMWGDPTKMTEALSLTGVGLALGIVELAELPLILFELLKPALGVVGELAEERVREAMPISKLDPATLTAAFRRNMIDGPTMDAEMRVQGYDGNRSELLRRLSIYVEDSASLVDYLFRGVVTVDDFRNGLRDLGYTEGQIQALQDASTRILDTGTAIDAWRKGLVDEATVDTSFSQNRFTEAERDLAKELAYAPPSYADAYPSYWVRRVLADYSQQPPVFGTIPPDVVAAGKADGLDEATILARWTAAVNTLPAQAWLQLYWRGQASLTSLQVALDRDRVPDFLQSNWIEAQRPLIPFRTIPGMVRAGLMDNLTAIQYLEKHGYSNADAILLMEYANRTTSLGSATRASTHHATSLSVAKTAYDDGLISRDQYVQILGEHGLDANAIALEVQLTDIEREAKARKQIGVDIINEYQAGLIDQQTALDRIHSSGYTLAEQAGVERKLRSARAGKAKIPDEAQQRAFAKADIITVDAYEAALVTIGYSEADAANFRELHFPAA